MTLLHRKAISVTAAAERLGMNRRTLYHYIAHGRVPHIRLIGKMMLEEAVVERILQSGELPTTDQPRPVSPAQW